MTPQQQYAQYKAEKAKEEARRKELKKKKVSLRIEQTVMTPEGLKWKNALLK